MLEARELVQQCVSAGPESAGYREFVGLAPGVVSLPARGGYRLYLESLFDELSTDVKVLFDRRDAASLLWPRHNAFHKLLTELNRSELSGVWAEDETIGWVYQFFNSKEERRKMRDESQAPRNSRELAVRNQFFTPRYVVQFLVDNTLGRTWYEMFGETELTSCASTSSSLRMSALREDSKIPAISASLTPHAVRDTSFSTPSTFLSRCTERRGSIRLRRWTEQTDRCVTCSQPGKILIAHFQR